MYNAPYQGVANNLAQYGRFGDSQLVHMNPIEVQMLASLSPTGRLTTNPMTGQQEAFLPFLAPLLGSFLGSSLLTGAGAGALGGLIGTAGLSSAAAGAIGSGLATTLATGDLEQGIMSGLTGFGLGSALGNLSKAVPGVTDAATAAPGITPEGIAPDLLASPTALADAASTSAVNPAIARELGGITGGTQLMGGTPAMGQFGAAGIAPAIEAAAPQLSAVTPTQPGFMDRLAQPFQQPGQLLSELAKPSSFLPMYVGETGRMARQQELMGRGSMRAFEEDQEAERQKTLGQIGDVFNRVRAAYPGVGYAQGGQVQGYFEGGDIENQIYNAMMQSQFAEIPAAKDVQLALRGQYAVPDIPRASYSALDVGGEGYMPGVAPEFQYFTSIDPNAPADGDSGEDAGIGPGPFPGGPPDVFDPNFDYTSLFGNFRGYQNLANLANLFGGGAGQPPMPGTSTDFIDPSMDQDVFAGGTPNFDGSLPGGGNFDPGLLEELLNQQFNPLQQRLTDIESRIGQTAPIDFSPIEGRFSDLESRLNQIPNEPIDFGQFTNRFGDLQSQLGNLQDQIGNINIDQPDLSGVYNRFGDLESRLGNIQAGGPGEIDYERLANFVQAPDLSQFENRFGELQSQLGGLQQQIGGINIDQPDLSGIYNRFGDLESRLNQLPQADFSGIESRLGGLESRLGNLNIPSAPDLSPIQQQIADLQSGIGALQNRQMPTVDLSGLESRLAAIEGRGAPQVSFDPIMERLNALEALISSQGGGGFSNQNQFSNLSEFPGFAEGGMTPTMESMDGNLPSDPDQLLRLTVAAIRGEVENADQIIQAFVDQYGSEVFMQIRNQVLRDIVPNAQTEGMVQGQGGGQDDLVNGMIGTQRPVAVSPGEYIIPADAVALAGGGYSGDGAKFFDGLVDDIRSKTMGTTEQIRPYRGAA